MVAPLAGSVDRNDDKSTEDRPIKVAPLAGSVDRNRKYPKKSNKKRLSLPSRGAWIEMVDGAKLWFSCKSLPSRGAWIEIRL